MSKAKAKRIKRDPSAVMLITGGASGIGAAMARLAVAQGHRVVIADIDKSGAERVAGDLGDAALAVALDIRSPAEWESVLDAVWDWHGRLDVLVNNAAVVHTGYIRDVALDRHRATQETNYLGPVTGMLATLPRFNAQGFGHFVTVCSMTAFLPYPGLASYAAAKHALRAFHHAFALEERHGPLDFTIVHPSATETPMLELEAQDDAVAMAFAGPSSSAESVAETILGAIDKKTFELFFPPERAKVVRRIGTSPRSLKKMVERNEVLGAEKLKARRAAKAATR
jgi:NAD(P)-dependent dehydrogenase (short-subunit alcohol dehydrogenase family)